MALELFQYQAAHNAVYAEYLCHLGCDAAKIQGVEQIPCLPVEIFKSHKVITGDFSPEAVFTSSATTSQVPSKHFVRDCALYERSFTKGFQTFYGDVHSYHVLALLPGYLEREGSSLIYMVNAMIQEAQPKSGFFLNEHEALHKLLHQLPEDAPKLLIGVTHALLDFAEAYSCDVKNLIVMETGGMKGRRKEMIRAEVHEVLANRFNVDAIHSEYGMTELLSQAYSSGGGRFSTPEWMQVFVKETDDPFAPSTVGKTGRIHIIDLANVDSCAFIASSDLGRLHSDATFEVLGRFDHAEVRGCNLMV